jgi:Putative restriction endonuclease
MTVAIEGPRSAIDHRPAPTVTDQQIMLKADWAHFKLLQQGCEQNPGAKLFYFEGTVEILMPGLLHENFSRVIGWMVTYFLLTKKQIAFTPTGSVTQEITGVSSAQADESYCLGDRKPIPDLSIGVIFSSGGLNKLSVYYALGVAEVWFWEDGTLNLYHRRDHGYESVAASELPGLEDLDFDQLKRCIMMAETDSRAAMETWAKAVGWF